MSDHNKVVIGKVPKAVTVAFTVDPGVPHGVHYMHCPRSTPVVLGSEATFSFLILMNTIHEHKRPTQGQRFGAGELLLFPHTLTESQHLDILSMVGKYK